jgi:hypothetical protein
LIYATRQTHGPQAAQQIEPAEEEALHVSRDVHGRYALAIFSLLEYYGISLNK